MRLQGEAYSQRLEEYATSTLQLISKVGAMSKDKVLKGQEITTNSELNEEEVVRLLTELLDSE